MKHSLYIALENGQELRGIFGRHEAIARLIIFLRDFRVRSFALVEVA